MGKSSAARASAASSSAAKEGLLSESLGKIEDLEDFKVTRLMGVFKAENYMCEACGTLYDYGKVSLPELRCGCGFVRQIDSDRPLRSSVTVFERVSPPWWDLTKEEQEAQEAKKKDALTEHPEIEQECPECGHDRLQFWTKQLRSADEGMSVFF
eukprot:CAMPEP_0206582174 /NCGR_PEP_ID=MMETSP0325_2-20121206/34310_1 /ASSEMBLY_ACC=CAM_ASM_000347 /TAXON_ID=2866 /ORGANISM="Crypthecodinium cohnii, Strain Seligo" /LENGTH=153 /DNA_ID=CAMNT_0054088771 /DNA_START=96 /DNA_END=555 /DNA_ORIENTATION=+